MSTLPLSPLSLLVGVEFPHLTSEVVRMLEAVDTEHSINRMQGIQAQEGNPWGVDFRTFGNARALLAAQLPNSFFNRVVGLSSGEVELLDEIMSFYERHQISPVVEILPNDLDDFLATHLSRKGFQQSRLHAAFFGAPRTDWRGKPGIQVTQVRSEAEFEEFLDAYLDGFEFPSAIREPARANMLHWSRVLHWRLYLARIDGVAAGVGILHHQGEIGYLAAGATRPSYRFRGCQQELIRMRLLDAQALGCKLICSQASFGSISHHNLENFGFHLAYMKSMWARVPSI